MRTRPTLVLSLLTLLAISGSPQENTAPSSTSRVIEIPLFATDLQGNPYPGLSASDVQIFEDKSPAQTPVALHNPEETPLLLGILIDTSGSEKSGKNYSAIVGALPDFVMSALNGQSDRVFVGTFAEHYQATSPLTKDEFANFKLHVKREGGTALYDAVISASRTEMETSQGLKPVARRVLLVVTDGEDDASLNTLAQATAKLRSTGFAVFALGTPSGSLRGQGALRTLARETGGDYFQLKGDSAARTLDAVRSEFAGMYVTTYRCVDPKNREGRHALKYSALNKDVKLRGPERF